MVLLAQSATKDCIRVENKTSVYVQVIHFTGRYTTGLCFSNHSSNFVHYFITQTQKNKTHVLEAVYIFRGHSTREPASSRVTYFIMGPTQTPSLATANTGKTRVRFGKNAGEWTERVEISKEEIPGSKRNMYGYTDPLQALKGRTFKFCVLNGCDFNFCVRSSARQG